MSGVFVKPSSITVESGAYSYKGTMPSPAQNYIDNNFPDLASLSQNQTFTGTDNFNGSVNFNGLVAVTDALTVSSGNITMLSGTSLTANSGSTTNMDGITNINGSYNLATATTSSATYSMSSNNIIVLCNTAGNGITVTLPSPLTVGHMVTIKQLTAAVNNILVNPHVSETIDGSASASITSNYGFLTLVSDGTNWWSISKI